MPFFQIEQVLYANLKLLCQIDNIKVGKKISGFIQDYVNENKERLGNLAKKPKEKKGVISMPQFLDEPALWDKYIEKTNDNMLIRTSYRAQFIFRLSAKAIEFRGVKNPELKKKAENFFSSSDGKELEFFGEKYYPF